MAMPTRAKQRNRDIVMMLAIVIVFLAVLFLGGLHCC